MLRRMSPFLAVALVASALFVVPALGANTEDAVRLHLGSNAPPSFSYDGVTQPLTTPKNGCQITSGETLIDLDAPGAPEPGINTLGLGVKSSGSNANGQPCGQIDRLESLSMATVTSTGAKLVGRSFNKVRLDVEMAGNAVVNVTFFNGATSKTATLQTGTSISGDESNDPGYDTSAPYEVTTANSTSGQNEEADLTLTDACAAPNSSGPNNAGNDNCLWTIDPGMTFQRISVTTTIGTFSI
jgi:hypothetical protein